MQPAVTLVHQEAMAIGIHAVRSFARHFAHTHELAIHTDGSVDEENQRILLDAAEGMKARIVLPAERKALLDPALAHFPKTRALLDGVGYNAKLELPMVTAKPYFYFDSDIVWLRHATNLAPHRAPNAFSTESWSWYNGIANDHLWIKAKTPARVNSGFHYISQEFPFEQMEDMLVKGMFDPSKRYNTDQEILAYLFKDMEYYHPEDLKRSRVRRQYTLSEEPCAALHFPGKMWLPHLDQITASHSFPQSSSLAIRYLPPIALTKMELLRMRARVTISNSAILGKPINLLRTTRAKFFN